MSSNKADKGGLVTDRIVIWHLLWAIPLTVAVIYIIWDYIEVHHLQSIEYGTMRYIYMARAIVIAFSFTLVAIYIVLWDRKKHEEKLQRALSDMRELDDLKNNFLSNVSHELKTPLTTINGYVKFMLSGKAGPLTEKQASYFRIMSEESDRLKHHIDELLFITTLESKPMEVRVETVDLHALASRVKDNMKVKTQQKDLSLLMDVPVGLYMRADKGRLLQLLTNLVDNSIKYTNPGGAILVRIKEKGKDINIQVIDSGIGIPEDKHDKVFERFYQVDSKVSRQYGGTGLGLAICREMVRACKGDIRIMSPLSKDVAKDLGLPEKNGKVIGTMFEITLRKGDIPEKGEKQGVK